MNESKESKSLRRRYLVPMNGTRITILGQEEPEDGTSYGI